MSTKQKIGIFEHLGKHGFRYGAAIFALSGIVAFVFALAYFVRPTRASGPSSNRVLNYQLRLTDTNGIPLNGTKNIKISFYDAASGGTRVHTDCGTTVTPVGRRVAFTNGVGTVLIGDTAASITENCTDASQPNAVPASLFSNATLYMGITVESDTEMTPRKRLVSAGFAANADFLDDLDTSAVGGTVAFVPVTDSSGNLTLTKNLTVDGTTLYVDSSIDSVGIGTAPSNPLHVSSTNNDMFRLNNPTLTNGQEVRQRFSFGGLTKMFLISELVDTGDDTANKFHVARTAGTKLFTVQMNGNVGIGDTSPAALLSVGSGDLFRVDSSGNASFNGGGTLTLGSKTTDPTGANGMTYYNTTDNKFRCFQNSAWVDCIGTGSGAMAIGGTVTSGTTGSLLFVGASSALAQDNANLFFDDTNNRFGIGTTSPAALLHARSNVSGFSAIQGEFENINESGRTQLIVSSGTYPNNFFSLFTHGSTYASDFYLSDSVNDNGVGILLGQGANMSKFAIGIYEAAPLALFTNNVQRMLITSTGNVGVGDLSPTALFTVGSGDLFQVSSAGDVSLNGGGTLTLGSKAADPTGANGMTYYNTTSNKFRCFQNSAWVDCIGTGSGAMAIGGTVTSGTTGSALFVGASSALAQDNANFFWDDTNNRLGVGTATPTSRLSSAIAGAGSVFDMTNSSVGGSTWQFTYPNGARGDIAFSGAWDFFDIYIDTDNTASDDRFQILSNGAVGAATSRFIIDASGRVGIADSSPTALFTVGSGDLFTVDSSGVMKVGSLSSDPSGTNGMTYYNTTSNLFRCYQGGAWTNCIGSSSGSPGGSNGQVQFNNSGAFGGDAAFTWDNTNKVLSLGSTIPANGQKLYVYQSGNTKSGVGVVSGVYRNFTDSSSVLSFGQVSTTDGTTYAENMRISSGGLVGIGTTNPFSGNLHVNRSTSAGLGGDIWITNSATVAVGAYSRLAFGPDATTDATPNAGIEDIVTNASTLTSDLSFKIYDGSAYNEKMRVLSTGNAYHTGSLGVGVSATPAERLYVVSADNTAATNIANFQALNLTQGIAIGWDEIRKTGSNANGDIKFTAKGTGSMYLQNNATGNIGVYTTSALGTFHIEAPALSTYGNLFVNRTSAGALGGTLTIANQSSTTSSASALAFNVDNSTAFDGSGNNVSNAEIRAINMNGANGATDLIFTSWSGSAETERMRLLSGGNITMNTTAGNHGIGTTTPNYKLDVATASSGTQMRFGSSTADSGGFLVSTNAQQALLSGGASWSGSAWIAKDTAAAMLGSGQVAGTGQLDFYTNSGLTIGGSFTPTPRMKIDSTGNTTVLSTTNTGTASPANGILKFDNQFDNSGNSTTNKIQLYDDGVGFKAGFGISINATNYFSGGDFRFWTDHASEASPGTNVFTIADSTGNVGIGDTSPAALLSVANGDIFQINSSGNVSTSGTITTTSTITSNATTGNTVVIDTSTFVTDATNNRVGIGTTSPQQSLHVQSGATETQLRVDNTSTTLDAALLLTDNNNAAGEGTKITYDSSVGDSYFNNLYTLSTNAFHFQSGAFTPGGTDLVTITTAGNVGVGEPTPASLFTVGLGDDFQVNSTGAITAITGYAQTTGTFSFTAPATATSPFTVSSSVNTGSSTGWSAIRFAPTNAQGTLANASIGLDVALLQNTAVAGNAETVARFSLQNFTGTSTDGTVDAIVTVANDDNGSVSGQTIIATDGIRITPTTASNITNGINFNGTFATNYITSTNFTVANSGNTSILNNATLSVTGNTTIGDASGDSITFNAATSSFPNAHTFSSALATGDVLTFSDTALTTGSLASFTTTNNSGSSTGWSAVKFRPTNAQGTLANASIGLDVAMFQNTAVAGNTETVARISLQSNTGTSTDGTVDTLLTVANDDNNSVSGQTIVVTDGIRITPTTASNITNGLTFNGTFGTNLISTSTGNFTVTQSGNTTIGNGAQLSVTGTTVLGDASGDTVTMNAGTSTFPNVHTFSSTIASGDVLTFTDASLTTGTLANFTSTNNSGSSTGWSAVKFRPTNAQATLAATVIGLDVLMTNSTAVAGNTESVARFSIASNTGTPTDDIISAIVEVRNEDNNSVSGNVITATDGVKVIGNAGGNTNVTNGINFSGTFGTNYITSTNFTVANSGNTSILNNATLSVTGNATLGDASGDSLTYNAATSNYPNAHTFTSSIATGNVLTFTDTSLTTGSLASFTTTNNSASSTGWSAVKFRPTNAQGTLAATVIGLDVLMANSTAVAGNTESVARFSIEQNNGTVTDADINAIVEVRNEDNNGVSGQVITAADGVKIIGNANGSTNVTNGINLSGTFGTNYITSTNFTVANSGNTSILNNATLSVTGNATLGDASGDSMTYNAATSNYPNAHTFTSSIATGNVLTFTDTSLTTGSLASFTTTNNSASSTGWSAVKFRPTNAQGTLAATVIGLDVLMANSTAVAGNTESVARFSIEQNNATPTDDVINAIVEVRNEDNNSVSGNVITATDGVKIIGNANGSTNVTNGINFSGTFGTNYITSTNFTVANSGNTSILNNATLSATGNVTVGDASGDSITFNAATSSFPNAHTFSSSIATGDVLTFSDTALTTGSLVNFVTTHNSGSSTGWTAVKFSPTNSQGTLANTDSTGFDLNWTQTPTVAGSTETLMRLQVAQNNSTPTDATVDAMLVLRNMDNSSVSGNVIQVTDALRIIGNANGSTNVTNGLNFSGTFGTNYITSTNFVVANSGAMTVDTDTFILDATNNRVGIGTTTPDTTFSVVSGGAPEPSGFTTMVNFGAPSGTTPMHVMQNAAETATPSLMIFSTSTATLGSIGAFGSNLMSVGGYTSKSLALLANNSEIMRVTTSGVGVNVLASATANSLCYNTSAISGFNTFATCSSSLKYKEDVHDLTFDMGKLLALRPVDFKWKDRDERSVGFIAEEVAQFIPEVITYKDGQIDGIEYKLLTAYLVNAIKDHEARIEALKGKLGVDGDGRVTVKELVAEKVRAKEFAVEADDETQTIGEGTILTGNSTVTVENPAIRANSRLFVTFYGNVEGSWWVSRKVDGAFDISLSAIAPTDLKFEYFIVDVLDNRTPPAPVAPPLPPPEAAPDDGGAGDVEVLPEPQTPQASEPEPLS